LSYNYSLENGLKQENALSQPLFSFALEYTLRKVQGNQVGLKLNGTHADDVNLLGDYIDTVKGYTKTLIDASKEVGPEVNTDQAVPVLLHSICK
jgi:hypothetical protein